jgi:hypothetical protein
MKNIYNLITDAFVSMGENESNYDVIVEFRDLPLHSYTITIKSLDPNTIDVAIVILLLDSSGGLVDYYTENTLFDEWDRFCSVLELQL